MKYMHVYVSRCQSYECICAARPCVKEGFSVPNEKKEKSPSSGNEDSTVWEVKFPFQGKNDFVLLRRGHNTQLLYIRKYGTKILVDCTH